MKHRFVNMYLTTTISVAMVLLLVGMECVLILGTHQLIRQLKEDVAVTVLLKPSADSTQIHQLQSMFENAPFTYHVRFVSKQQALQEHIEALGEDPEKFLGYNPLSNSFEVNLHPAYANEDSIALIEQQLSESPYIESVSYPQEIVSLLDMHLGHISLVLILVAVVLLLISMVLIVNTVRLHVYSKRFLIHTMRLVGATSWVIRAPFVGRNLRLGLEAGVAALVALMGVLWLMHERLGVWLCTICWQNILITVTVVLLGGELITFAASMIATGRYIRMNKDRMYEI